VQIDPRVGPIGTAVATITPGTPPATPLSEGFECLARDGFERCVCKMRIRNTEYREQLWNALRDATGESTTSGALDAAAVTYLELAGGTTVRPTGKIEELMQLAEDQGSVTPDEIADVLDVDELPVEHEREWSVGRE